MGGPRAEVRLVLADGKQWSQVWPLDARAAASSITAGVRHGGAPVGEIEVGMDADLDRPSERRLLDELAAPAGLALSTVRLTFDLRQRIDDLDRTNASLRASSRRMLTAQRGEQRRLEREVNDHIMGHVADVETAIAALRVAVQPRALSEAQDSCELALERIAEHRPRHLPAAPVRRRTPRVHRGVARSGPVASRRLGQRRPRVVCMSRSSWRRASISVASPPWTPLLPRAERRCPYISTDPIPTSSCAYLVTVRGHSTTTPSPSCGIGSRRSTGPSQRNRPTRPRARR